jgi:GTPase SAR1 family protein
MLPGGHQSVIKLTIDKMERKGRVINIITLGNTNVGKTSVLYRYTGGTFVESVKATVGVERYEK